MSAPTLDLYPAGGGNLHELQASPPPGQSRVPAAALKLKLGAD